MVSLENTCMYIAEERAQCTAASKTWTGDTYSTCLQTFVILNPQYGKARFHSFWLTWGQAASRRYHTRSVYLLRSICSVLLFAITSNAFRLGDGVCFFSLSWVD